MNNKTKKYLDKVIEFIVVDTIIDYKQKMVRFPFPPLSFISSSFLFLYSSLSSILPSSHPFPSFLGYTFEKYCKDIYGLTEEETEYVWKQYRDIINNKIEL